MYQFDFFNKILTCFETLLAIYQTIEWPCPCHWCWGCVHCWLWIQVPETKLMKSVAERLEPPFFLAAPTGRVFPCRGVGVDIVNAKSTFARQLWFTVTLLQTRLLFLYKGCPHYLTMSLSCWACRRRVWRLPCFQSSRASWCWWSEEHHQFAGGPTVWDHHVACALEGKHGAKIIAF